MLSNLISHSTVIIQHINTLSEYNTCRLQASLHKQIQTSADFIPKFIYLGVTQIHVSPVFNTSQKPAKQLRYQQKLIQYTITRIQYTITSKFDLLFFNQENNKMLFRSYHNSGSFSTLKLFREFEQEQSNVCSFHAIIIEILRGKKLGLIQQES